jgi:hypothetical protein
MTISRRPNLRASNDAALGPRSTTATAITRRSTLAGKFAAPARQGSPPKAPRTTPTAMSIPANGARTPIESNAPITHPTMADRHVTTALSVGPLRQMRDQPAAVAPNVTRSMNSAQPVNPPGYDEEPVQIAPPRCSSCVASGAVPVRTETVKVHVRKIMEKLGAQDRTQAVAIAVRRGITQL